MDLFREVDPDSHLLDHAELRFEPVDVLFLIDKNLLEQFTRSVVTRRHGGVNRSVQPGQRRQLQGQIVLELRLHILADLDGEHVGHVGHAFEEQ